MFRRFLLPYIFILIFCFAPISEAKKIVKNTNKHPIQTSLVIDAKNGKVLQAHNAQVRIYPASLTKLMTLYLIFEAIESRKLSLDKKLLVSAKASKMPHCKLGLRAGDHITVREAINGLIIKSANDVAVTVAEGMKGSEKAFAHLMNVRAKTLGMKNTFFKNASGLHDPFQQTTARDIAKLAIALKRDYPKYYPLFSKTHFVFRGNVVNGHNSVTKHYQGAEGMKTGFHTPAGYNLVTTASRNNKSLIAVITGGKSAASRDQKMMRLLDHHFGVKTITSKPSIKLASNNKANTKAKSKIIKRKNIRS
ncbi:D-alanyl-D-alanine carboxypeptidase family protein [Rickettsia prowazekii]|uniref:PENICILLIN-BINDING PROTEIN DACF (DacF) n=2 Tax=Rickettsia prowazekii TaxID=782 RepID=Q9ZDE2_RICPR|nr:D-alanyl-D-alanine carboxypeptidase family protein [Rickettsia prowazekii]ADE29915.1 Penicillin-binding protein dacF precursor [Rickettsia prowazekii str. Rp22]AFE49202.1 penicillin-binding protein DACF precursor (dacF) [Rickettsia prowazekii str. Chernikova]AFE50048.1 penicillin-binding protein DACF precursor (dacF) [Rickettsia prowazekii str. Katsinyian]AFE50893.1 penicillin-binding protein DACF precursor (dacF) [Rickettsia prowazekii str. BuV67-CWPP]AFE51729.1 penicillin-binding protein 